MAIPFKFRSKQRSPAAIARVQAEAATKATAKAEATQKLIPIQAEIASRQGQFSKRDIQSGGVVNRGLQLASILFPNPKAVKGRGSNLSKPRAQRFAFLGITPEQQQRITTASRFFGEGTRIDRAGVGANTGYLRFLGQTALRGGNLAEARKKIARDNAQAKRAKGITSNIRQAKLRGGSGATLPIITRLLGKVEPEQTIISDSGRKVTSGVGIQRGEFGITTLAKAQTPFQSKFIILPSGKAVPREAVDELAFRKKFGEPSKSFVISEPTITGDKAIDLVLIFVLPQLLRLLLLQLLLVLLQ